jgi:opacity protein-like surface antigen
VNDYLGFYTRYEDVEAARDRDRFSQWQVGLNWWPHENVVVKFDYRDRSHDNESSAGRDFHGIDIGIGYNF